MSIHQGVKAEIDARTGLHEECIELARILIEGGHYASEDIRAMLTAITEKRNLIVDRWQERWEWLTLRKSGLAFCECVLLADSSEICI